MNFNPMDSHNDNDSKKSNLSSFKIIAHEGLMPATIKMLQKCLKQKKKQLDGVEFTKIQTLARIEQASQKANNKLILKINDNTGSLRIVAAQSEQNDELEIGAYYRLVLLVKEDKDEPVILCEKMERVGDFGELQLFFLQVIQAAVQRRNIRNRG